MTIPVGGISTGSIFSYESGSSAGTATHQLGDKWVSEAGSFALASGGDAIFVYCLDDGPDGTPSVPVFLTAATYSVDGWSQPNTDESAFLSGQSALPSDLSPTSVVTLPHKDNYLYVGPRTGTLADLRLALSDGSSGTYWDGNDATTNLDVLNSQAPFAILPTSQCTSPTDCGPTMNDCTTPVCEGGDCSIENKPNDTPCTDDDIFTHGDKCFEGVCYGTHHPSAVPSSMPSSAPVTTESTNPSSSPSSSPVAIAECSCPMDYTCVEPICTGGCGGCTDEALCSQSDGCAWSKQDPACVDPPATCGEINDVTICTTHGCAWSNDPVTCDTKAACNAGNCPGCSWSGKLKSCVDDTDSPCSGGSSGGRCTGADPTPCDRTCNGTQEPFTCQPPPPQCRQAGTSCVDDTDACCGSCSCWTKGKKAGQCECQ